MPGSWGSKRNKIQVGIFYDSIQKSSDGTKARPVGIRLRIRRGVRIEDTSNTLKWYGGGVENGSDSGLTLNGVGDKTLATPAGEWQKLSTSGKKKVNITVELAGVNYAGGTLKHTITVSLPQLDPEQPDPPDEDTDPGVPFDFPNLWEDPDAPDIHLDPDLQHTYQVLLTGAPDEVVPAWDVEVSLDGSRAPYGVARFKAPLDWITERFKRTLPFRWPTIRIQAGWTYGLTLNRHTIFYGYIMSRRLVVDESNAYVEFTAETYETMLSYPSNANLAINNSWTSLGQFLSANSDTLYRVPKTWSHPGNLLPSPAQLAEFRAMTIEAGDDVLDFVLSCASTLGQWVRGRIESRTPTVDILTDPYPYVRLWELPIEIFTSLDRTEDVDQWANILRLETRWTDPSTGDAKSKKKRYIASGVAAGGSGAVRGRDVVLDMRPPGGETPSASWAVGKRWLRRIDTTSRGSWTGQARAIWWLQPRIDGVELLDNPVPGEIPGPLQSVTYQVDRGLMTLTWTARRP